MQVIDIIYTFYNAKHTGCLVILDKGIEKEGYVYYYKGSIYSAEYGKYIGYDALFYLVSLQNVDYKFYNNKFSKREDFQEDTIVIIEKLREVIMLGLNKKIRLIPEERRVSLSEREWRIIALSQRGVTLEILIKLSGYEKEEVLKIVSGLQDKGVIELVDNLLEYENAKSEGRKYTPKVFWTTLVQELKVYLGPVTKEIILDEIYNLGEKIEKFPISKLPLLVEKLSQEIDSKIDRLNFQKKMLQTIKKM
ncbi:hypothetical protein SAMN04488516_101225 [Desulfonauticus submarinus]|uniref:DUF8082 domain-containing protein n=1 Tax=Desulfonauticus submarinus TaxID=206665 RepID=A0A1G9ZZA6_9BACT|nr:hypothetical protein [Desulfonauticus submarinus]SDN26598.1 hypothetical protein SAMN04488516_101225 [Desulfonauticus submarinus]